MRATEKIWLVSIFLLLSSNVHALEEDKFTLNDPPRRDYSTAEVYESSIQSLDYQFSSESGHVLSGRLAGGRQLVDKIYISPQSPDFADSSWRAVSLHLIDGARELEITGSINTDGSLMFEAGGLYASAVKILIPGTHSAGNPITNIRIQSIALDGSTRIMLIGDSITYGKFADNFIGYRHMLYDRLDGDGANIDFVGDFGDPPYEGHFQGGEKINDFYPRGLSQYATGEMDVTHSMNQYRPNIVAIHLGTNDLNSETGYAIAPYGDGSDFYDTQIGEMATLIDYLLKWHNGEYGAELEHILVSLIIPIKYRDSVCVEFNLELARLVNDFRTGIITGQPEPVVLVDQFSRFREWPGLTDNYYRALMYDSLHPNNAGHSLMADVYHRALTWLLSGQRTWFTDITWEAELFGRDVGYNGDFAVFENQGVAAADFNNDGLQDIYTTRTNSDNPNAHDFLYTHSGSLPYSEVAESLNVSDPGGSRGTVFIDIDSDGDLDLFNAGSGAQNRLYRNDGNRFTDITNAAGIADLARVTTGLVAADFDNDGNIDLYAVNSREQNELYLNDGAGFFQLLDRGANDAVEPSIPSLSASAADFDNDGDVDIYIVKRGGPNALFVNDGSGYFSEKAASFGIALNANSNGAVWADLDNDADLDLLVATTDGGASMLHAFENNGTYFADRTSHLTIEMSGYSPIAADFDNDGDLDIIATQESDYAMFHQNNGNWNFTQINDTGAEIHGGDIRGAGAFDYDDDGDLDLFAARADMFNVLLQNNLASAKNFIKIAANGPNDQGGIGSKIWLYETGHLNDPAHLIAYSEIFSANGHISQPPSTQHFGLDSRQSCDILVRFINGEYAALRNTAANQTVSISPVTGGTAGDPALIALYSGDNQQGTVGQDLADPIIVQVTDAQGRPVPEIDVSFQVTSGDAQLFLPQTSGERLSIEMEKGQLNGLSRVADESASAGAFVMALHDNTGSSHMQKEFQNEGDYFIWLRAWNNGPGQSINMNIDGVSYSVTIPTTNGWQWFVVDAQPFSFSAGMHNFEISLASTTLQCDKFLLLLNGNYTPTGAEDNDGSPMATDASGLARRYVRLGDSAGPITINASVNFDGQLIPGSPIIFYLTSLPGEAASMQKTGGDNQNGQPGVPLTEPFVVTLLDALGNPVPNVQTTFTVLSGGGSLTTDSIVLTDAQGRAQNTLIPGESSSLQRVQVEAANVSGSPAIFQANISGVARELKYISGDSQAGVVKSILSAPIKIQVLAEDSQPAVQFAVQFSTRDEGALLSPQSPFSHADTSLTVLTDENGYAQVWWQLGQYSGKQHVQIEAGSLAGSPMTLRADAIAGQPGYMLLLSGDGQTGRIQTELPQPFVVKVMDDYGNGIPDYSVLFAANSGAGTFDGLLKRTVETDSSGLARAVFKLATTAGADIIIASASASVNNIALSGSPVTFRATVLPANAAVSEMVSGNNQSAIVDSDLAQPFVIRVTDSFNNPVSGETITFKVVQGNGTLDRSARLEVITDEHGLAAALYHTGTTVGEHRIRAICSGLAPEEHLFTVKVWPRSPHALDYISGNDQTGAINAPLPEPLIVRVADRFGNAVSDAQVQWQVISTGGNLDGERLIMTQTDAQGFAQTTFTLGDEMGDSLYSVAATAEYNGAALMNSPVVFVASAGVGEAASLVALSPTENLVGAANHEPQEPIRVRVMDENGLPVAGFAVDFQILAGGGKFAENNSTIYKISTDANGIARARWVLGGLGVQQHLRCMAIRNNDHLENSPLFFTASTVESQPQRLLALSGDAQTGSENSPLPEPFIVQVLDEFDAPFAGQPVFFAVQKGDGIFTESGNASLMTETTADGKAAAHFKLGADVGENAYAIEVRSFSNSGLELQGSPVTFHASGTAQRLLIVSGDEQTGVVNTLLPTALKVQAVDENGAGIAGIEVLFSKESGDGEFITNPSPQTNENGIARVQFKLGKKSGRIVISADAPAIGRKIRFHLTALTDDPAGMLVLSGDGQTGVAGHRLNQDIVVKVVDQYDNGVSGIETRFTPQSGHGQVLPESKVTSDSLGLIRTQWILGPTPGEQYLFVSNEELASLPLQISAHALPNQAPHIVLADSFAVNENELLSFTISVTDAENDSISLDVQNLPTGATFETATKQFSWRPNYNQAGVYPLIIQAADHAGARRLKITTITVSNSNRPPVISSQDSRPLQHQLGRVEMQTAVDFFVSASDPDTDPLHYLWTVNDQPVSTQQHFTLQAQLLAPGPATVQALVFDQSDTAAISWSLEIITAIKLVFFKAEFAPYKGTILSWKTSYEWGNQGFTIQRATRKDGPFVTVSPLIKSSAKGEYQFIDTKASAGMNYFYRLQEVQADGLRREHAVVTLKPPLPQDFALHASFPNPFNSATRIQFDVADYSQITLKIYDLLGRQVKILIDERLAPGFHTVSWNGTNQSGNSVASGVYYALLTTPRQSFVQKMVVLR